MKKNFYTVLILLLVNINLSFSQERQTLTAEDLTLLVGVWEGSLTYRDYQTDEPYTLPAMIQISNTEDKHTLKVVTSFPNEPKANNTSTWIISENGTKLNGEKVVSVKKLGDGGCEIITNEEGIDGNDNKPALMKITYTIGKETFTNKKEVLFEGTKEWIERNKFSATRSTKQ
ncbi:MAG: hypothetical protein R2793_08820 [Flavobacteriaceae bacterium]